MTLAQAVALGIEVVLALVEAAKEGLTHDEAVQRARDVLSRRAQVDADVDAAARGTRRP